MPVKKRAAPSASDGLTNTKRLRRQQNVSFGSHDLWKNLDRVRTSNELSDVARKHSHLFVPIYTQTSVRNAKFCVLVLQEYIESSKIQLHICQGTNEAIAFISLRNFSLLDCCLVLSVLYSLRNKNWHVDNKDDLLSIPRNAIISGTFYLSNNCTVSRMEQLTSSKFSINESDHTGLSYFKEYHVVLPHNSSLSNLTSGISSFFAHLKFGKCKRTIDKDFKRIFCRSLNYMKLSIHERYLPNELLFDMAVLTSMNGAIIEKSKESLVEHGKNITIYNESDISSNPSVDSSNAAKNPGHQSKHVQVTQARAVNSQHRAALGDTSRYAVSSNGSTSVTNSYDRRAVERSGTNEEVSSNYMTQEQIKHHCQATIRASMDALKRKSPYQIFTMYVKCPRQKYIDIIYQNLNDLRSQSNCNILILNLNNLNESKPWFDALDTRPYTTFANTPHPSTVRIISIGGIGEHMAKALELISKLMEC